MESCRYTARWLFPVSGPPLERGVLVVRNGRIDRVLPAGSLTADVDLGNAALLPGLVNAHTHLDLTGARGRIPPTDPDGFCDWLQGVIAFRRERSPEDTTLDIEQGLRECLAAGTTLLGDVSAGGTSSPQLQTAPLRSVLFHEIIGLAPDRFALGLDSFLAMRQAATPIHRVAPSPHAPYSANHEAAIDCLNRFGGALHLAESPGEMELLEQRTGPFVDFLKSLGAWQESALTHVAADFIRGTAHSDTPKLFIHCNYLTEVEFAASQTVVFCPRTHADFRHAPHPVRSLLARGTTVALGTDSAASNPDLDIFAEARFLHDTCPDLPRAAILQMLTLNGARALGWADACGSLEPGKSADCVVLPLPDEDARDPHDLIFRGDAVSPRRTMFRGVWRDG